MEQQFIVTTIRAIKNQQKLTIKQLFQAFWNTILGPKYKQFLNHYVSEELNDRKKSWAEGFYQQLSVINEIESMVTTNLDVHTEPWLLLFQLIANYVKNIDNRILKYEIIAKLYFLEINGLNLNQGLQFRSLDKKLQFSFQEKQFLLQKINQETQLLTNLKENFYQATNQLMLSLHQLLNKNNKNFQSQINWNLSWIDPIIQKFGRSYQLVNNLKLFHSYCLLIKDQIMLETNEPNDYEQYELQTVKWLEFLIKIALTKEHKQWLIYKNFWYHETNQKQIVIKVNINLLASLIKDFQQTCLIG